MKNLFVILLIFTNCLLFAQKTEKTTFLSSSEFGVYGGMNFNTPSHIYGSVYFEAKTNLSSNIKIKLSAGYYQIFSFDQYTVNTYKYVHIDDYKKYNTITYDVIKTKYDVIPLALGTQFIILKQNVSAYYVFFDASYNLIDPLTYQTPEIRLGEYDSLTGIPNNYKNLWALPNNSYSLALGVGSIYQLFSSFSLDIRYFYNYDSKIINTHQLLIGVVF